MKLNACTLHYTCPGCGEEFDINVEAYYPAKLTGPAEYCYPSFGGEFEPTQCPSCAHLVDEYWVSERQRDKMQAQMCNEADFRRKDKMEGYK